MKIIVLATNELETLKFSLMKALKGSGRVDASKRTFCKKVSVDVPMSKVTFNSLLRQKFIAKFEKR